MKNNDTLLSNPWAGRFSEKMSQKLIEFNTSLPIESRLIESDIKASVAHVQMLEKTGLLVSEEVNLLVSELENIRKDWRMGQITFRTDLEDIHMNLEVLLTDRLGDVGKKVHTARSRNDQQAIAQRIYFKESTQALIKEIKQLQRMLYDCCERNYNVIMPSYTHLQRAEFTYFPHWLATYIVMLDRDQQRLTQCIQRADECPLGACASTGTSLPIDRELTAKILGFREPTVSSIDSVSDRDYLLEFTSDAAILMIHLSRLAEEIIIFASKEFDFLELADNYCTGSSIMPQKKNPDVLELIRGKTGTVIGNSVSLLTLMKCLTLGYNKDMQEDKTSWFSALDNSMSSVVIMGDIINTMHINEENMLNATKKGHIIATEYANYLVKRGMPFREAHKTVGNLVKLADKKNVDISQLDYETLRSFSTLFSEDIKRLSIQKLANLKESKGSCGEKALRNMMKEVSKKIETC